MVKVIENAQIVLENGIEYTIETTKDDVVESYKYVKLV